MNHDALVLVAMTIVDVHERDRVVGLAESVGGSVAFLQQASPALVDELTRLADGGADPVRLVGVSTASQSPAASWLRRVAGHWHRERAELGPRVEVATTMLRDELSPGSLALALEATKPIHGQEAPLVSAAWEHVPGHRNHVLVCRGPRCSARGAEATADALNTAIRHREMGNDDVLVTQTGCLFPCNHAPVVCVHPADTWYGRVDPETAESLVGAHLVAGQPLHSHRLPRSHDTEETP